MTSNLGSDLIRRRMEENGSRPTEEVTEGLRRDLLNLLKERLRPEFLNRVDEIVVFRPLGREQIRRIVELQFESIRRAAAKTHGLDLRLTEAAKDVLAREGYDPAFGARPLKRVLQRQIANQLAEQVLAGFVRDGDAVIVDAAKNGGVTLTTVPAGQDLPEEKSVSVAEDPEVHAPAGEA
jgi:ATP-dependent Clp protease ATP-binding subunit ClpB